MRPILLAPAVCSAVACSAFALVAAGSAGAGQPVTQTLTPPPPDWQTCKAVGSGTICEGTNVESVGPYDTGIACGIGVGAFTIFDTSTDDYFVRKWFDEDGNLVRRYFHDHYTFGQFSNPLTGATVPYTQTDTRTDVLAVPGDLSRATTTTTWEIVFHLPGGAPQLRNTGRTVIAPDGTVTARAGQLPLFANDPATFDRLCTALAE